MTPSYPVLEAEPFAFQRRSRAWRIAKILLALVLIPAGAVGLAELAILLLKLIVYAIFYDIVGIAVAAVAVLLLLLPLFTL